MITPAALAEHFDHWQPTPEAANALPEPLRRYIHGLETMADPAGLLRENTLKKEQIYALSKKLMADDILSNIPGELLAPTRNGLPHAQPDGPDTQRILIRLPDGARAEVTLVKLKSKKGKMTRWFWTPDSAVLLESE